VLVQVERLTAQLDKLGVAHSLMSLQLVRALPLNPASHAQEKLPGVLVHVA
jgi:hypothetical protein